MELRMIREPSIPILEHSSVEPKPSHPFDDFFSRYPQWSPPPGGLLDTPNAHRWFEVVKWGVHNDLYICQQPIQIKSGPRTRLDERSFLVISAYDYLGLIGHKDVESAAIEAIRKYGTGTGGVRLLSGTTDLHQQFEKELAAFKGTEASITFNSGYMANLAVIPALLGPHDLVISDSRAHRSITDACRLARVPERRFLHNDLVSLDHALKFHSGKSRILIVVEGVYSMDGDLCPLPEIVELKKKYGAFLMVDEAHSFGVLGSTGRGLDEYFGVKTEDVDLWTGSLSKAIPSNGGFIAGSRELIIYLQHGAAPFMFSAALCPAAVASALASLRILKNEPGRLVALHNNADVLRSSLAGLGFDTGKSASPVIPVILGDDGNTCWFSRELFRMGILSTAILFPAVPLGASRIRLCATAAQDGPFLEEVLIGFRKIRAKVRPLRRE